ncbi:MAG: HEAT repeat domain-containing protein [Chloroflexota bacterium]
MSDLPSLLADLLGGDETRAEQSVSGLIALDTQALPALQAAARSADADGRWWIVRALAELPSIRNEDLLPFLEDSAPEVRQAAALGLGAQPTEIAVPHLARALHDPDSMTAGLAANALGRLGPASTPALLEVLNGDSQGVRILAMRALSEVRDHRAIPAMMKALDDDSAIIQHWAREGLEKLGLDLVFMKPN